MKKITLALISSMCLSLNSCRENFNIDTNEGAENTKEKILEAFGSEKKVNSLEIITLSSNFIAPSEFDNANISFIENNEIFDQYFYAAQQKAKKPINNSESINDPRIKNAVTIVLSQMKESVKLKSFDFNEIPIKIEAAKKLLSKGYKYHSINSWRFEVSNNRKIELSFCLRCSYENQPADYFVNFRVDEDGVLKKFNL